MPDIHLPEVWVLIAPCGCVDGVTLAVYNGHVRLATAEAAWARFTPLKRDRDREAKQGFRIEGREERVVPEDCQHDPKWGIR